MFSVVVPLYNKIDFVGGAVRSALDQEGAELEVIVVDDGSTDGGASVVAAIDDPRVRLVQQCNAGVSAARNRGIVEARHDIVCFLDADDFFYPGYLQLLRRMVESDPAAIAYATAFRNVDASQPLPEPPVIRCPPQYARMDDPYQSFIDNDRFATSSIAVRRRALQELAPPFQPGESHGEDLDLWFRLASHGPIVYSRAPLVAYRRQVPGSLASTQRAVDLLPAYRRLRQRLLGHAVPPALRASAWRLIAFEEVSLARLAYLQGRRLAAVTMLGRASRAGRSRYWWTTLMLSLLMPRSFAQARDRKRYSAMVA